MRIALAQTNPTIGDVVGNCERVIALLNDAHAQAVDLVIFPEQTILGYPAKDLLLRTEAVEANAAAIDAIAKQTVALPAALVGYAEPNSTARGRPVHNTAALLSEGRIAAKWRKRLLPTYDVFDDARYFEPAGLQQVFDFRGLKIGVTICEDLLAEPLQGRSLYDCDPAADLARAGVGLIINISASPFVLGKPEWRLRAIGDHALRQRLPIAYVNQVGGNDEVLFDGASFMVGADGELRAQARAFEEDFLIVDLERPQDARREQLPTGAASLHDALIMGLRDYVRKCGFRDVVIGLSGGIDSSVVAALAVTALGAAHVHGVAMPSRFSSGHSVEDARALAANLGIRFSIVPIEPMHAAFEQSLAPLWPGRDTDVTEENIQSRIRGVTLMALSNKFGALVLTTGNKSEVAVGYCTLYGDMCGGLAVISDVPKTMIYPLARRINERFGRAVIPERVFQKAPSAELRPNQTDQDSLPPYETLDAILERHEEQFHSATEIVAAGFSPAVVADVLRKIRISEYKRQQAAPGLKVTSRAFGFGRRMPIAAKA
ncbi:MAG: NAD+ synthase [Phycisphaerae bacterium]